MPANDLIIYRRVEQVLYNLYPRLIKYPKSEKYSLCQSIKNTLFEMLKYISLGNSVKSKRRAYLQEADGHLQVLKVLVCVLSAQKNMNGNTRKE